MYDRNIVCVLLFFIDIPLLPSITSLSLSDNNEKSGPFVVHWLNNKELHFTLSMEVFLQQLRKSFEQPSSEPSVEDANQADVKSDEGKALTRIKKKKKCQVLLRIAKLSIFG